MVRGPAIDAGPLRLWRCAAGLLAPVLLAGTAACAGGAGPGGAPRGGVEPALVADDAVTRLAESEVEPVRLAYEAGRLREAAGRADSLYSARRDAGEPVAAAVWLSARLWELAAAPPPEAERPPFAELLGEGEAGRLRREGTRRLAVALASVAEEPAAVRVLLAHPEAEEARSREALRELTRRLSLAELEAVALDASADPAALAVVRAGLARALALAGRADSARRTARAVLDAEADRPDERLAREVERGEVEQDPRPLRIGAILPLSGSFAAAGTALREGVELALAGRPAEARPVELIIRDDRSDPERAVPLLRELEALGAVGVIGPIRSEALDRLAAERAYPGLLLLSPTATEVLTPRPHAYTLWSRVRREADGARALGRWLPTELGVRRLATLRPEGAAGEMAASAFRTAADSAGATVVAEAAYDPDSTTFEAPITAVVAAAPEAVFVAADGGRTVLQLAPQLSFYGLRATLVAGGPAWSDPEVVRRLDPRFADYRVVAAFLDRVTPAPAWQEFRAAYETTYRKGIPDNLLPALGHDAARLLLAGIPPEGPAPAGAVARGARQSRHGVATGDVLLDPATSTAERRIWIRILRDRALAPAEPREILTWAEEARRHEELRRELLREQEAARAAADSARRESGR